MTYKVGDKVVITKNSGFFTFDKYINKTGTVVKVHKGVYEVIFPDYTKPISWFTEELQLVEKVANYEL